MSQIPYIQELIRKHFLENANKYESETQNSDWITAQDPSLIKLILESFADEDKKNILNAVLDEPKTISEILKIAKIPQTSGYRKVNALIDDGLLVFQGYVTTYDVKKINKYKSIFENIMININQNSDDIKILFTKKVLEKYSTIKVTHN